MTGSAQPQGPARGGGHHEAHIGINRRHSSDRPGPGGLRYCGNLLVMSHAQFLPWLFAHASPTPTPSPSPSATSTSPQVIAAIIAASVAFLTLIGTLLTAYFSRRATKRDLEEQRKQLDKTLAEQRTKTLNERFATAAGQLGGDKPPAVRLAGVYAMAGLADDWPENRQTCIDVLCGYLRMPDEPDPGDDAPGPEACLPGQPRGPPHRHPDHHRAPPSRRGRGEVLAGLGLRFHRRCLRRR